MRHSSLFQYHRLSQGKISAVLLLWLVLLLQLQQSHYANAAVPCNRTLDCTIKLASSETICDSRGYCTNPFASGCLRVMAERYGGGTTAAEHQPPQQQRRVCNSQDNITATSQCRSSPLNFTEIVIAPGNWESSMFLTWILQIILSEKLDVPASTSTSEAGSFSFYDLNNNFVYPAMAHNWDALERAHTAPNADCTLVQEDCAHVIPEVWSGQKHNIWKLQDKNIIDAAEGNGEVGKISFYIPAFTAERDWTLASFYGLQGEVNRKKMAETFKRPTNWVEYCHNVSKTNCSRSDDTAQRYPLTLTEQKSYFVNGLYRGYFRATDKNDCDKHPTNCTGHIVDCPCEWSTYTESQLHWNNISLSSDGPLPPNNGYSNGHMIQIWHAANATKQNVMFWWYEPDPTVTAFSRTEAEFQPVLMPEPTEDCLKARVSNKARCSSNVEDRLGDKVGSCDSEAHALQKILVSSLKTMVEKAQQATRSPAYEFIQQFQISDVAIDALLKKWVNVEIDQYGYGAREVVCKWVYDNVDTLERFIPQGYPRVISQDDPYSKGFLIGAQAVGAFALLIVMGAAILVCIWRKKRIIICAQILFLILILVGFAIVAIGAILYPMEPTDASCMAKEWLVTLGYTVQYIPLLVKVAAINKLLQGANEFKRVVVNPYRLKLKILVVVGLVTVYMIAWTVVDPPVRTEEYVLESYDSSIVHVSVSCASSTYIWKSIAMGWEGLLLLCTLVLAFQSRRVKQEYNESQSLVFMTYSHFLFGAGRAVNYVLPTDKIDSNVRAGIESYLLSFDTVCTLLVYLGPKFLMVMSPNWSRRYSWLNSNKGIIGLRSVDYSSSSPAGPAISEELDVSVFERTKCDLDEERKRFARLLGLMKEKGVDTDALLHEAGISEGAKIEASGTPEQFSVSSQASVVTSCVNANTTSCTNRQVSHRRESNEIINHTYTSRSSIEEEEEIEKQYET